MALWEDGYKDPWLILTDLPPEASDAGWYGLRAWIEQGFKITKRAGWSCPCSLRLIQQPDKLGKMPSFLHVCEGVLPWYLIFSSISSR